MKNLLLLILTGFLLLSCGRKDDEPTNPIDQLPPATQTGANTIGCLVNGEVMLPYQNNPLGSPSKNCYYQLIDGFYKLGISFSNDKKSNLRNIGIFTNKIQLSQATYLLGKNEGISNECKWGYYSFIGPSYFTTEVYQGELKITKLDKVKNIISGTFWYDAVNASGEVVQIREGRFDFTYTP